MSGAGSAAAFFERLTAVASAALAEKTLAPLFPLRKGVWYKQRDGKFCHWREGESTDGGNYWKLYQSNSFSSVSYYDYERFTVATGKCESGNSPSEDIVDYAEDKDRYITNAQASANIATAKAAEQSADLYAALLRLNKEASEAAAKSALESVKHELTRDIITEVARNLAGPVADAVTEQVGKQTHCKELNVKTLDKINTVHSPHPMLEEAIEISRAINNVWLCGPAGSGKTTLAHQLADALGLDFSFISCTAGMSEAKLLGRMNVAGTYLPAEFVRIYEEGGVFLWDEFDAADPNVVLCANAAMANGHLSVPDRVGNPIAKRHKDTILIVATNTWGRGSTSEYSARESLDAATRDRFVLSKIAVDYAAAIEWQFLGAYDQKHDQPWKAPALNNKTLPNVFQAIRANIGKHHLKRIMSTRAFAQGAALRALGWSDQKILERYFLDWSEQERTKALEGVC